MVTNGEEFANLVEEVNLEMSPGDYIAVNNAITSCTGMLPQNKKVGSYKVNKLLKKDHKNTPLRLTAHWETGSRFGV